ncbi:MAG TPA: capsule assembly Wzi family protein [Gemmatimonadaceae bacterium]|nr:capsule assembly Wzi family protein [Gemmatimonadaceae bacterium]
MPILTPSLRRAIVRAVIALAFAGAHAQAQTASVPPLDEAYADLDRLSELGFLDSVIVAQRPYSRREMGRILRAARERSNQLGERSQSQLITDLELSIGDGILRRLEMRFSREIEEIQPTDALFKPVEDAQLAVYYTDVLRRGFVGTYGRTLEATMGSLLPRRLGTIPAAGTTTWLEISQRLEATSWLAFTLRERAQYAWAKDTALEGGTAEIVLGTMRMRYRNVALEIGRSQLSWAQSADEGLFIAADAPALDLISLSSDEPFVLPSVLRVLGPTKATLFVADLGPSQVRSHSKLLGYKVSISPSPRAELGASFFNHYGGEGGRPSSFGDRLIDFLPFVDIFRRHNYTDSSRALDVDSDKLLGLDGRLRIGGLRGVVLTGELLIDDFDVRRIPKLFTGYGSQALGITLPRFISPVLSLKLMATHMGILTYTHSALSNGITTRGRLIGDELGPDAKAFGARLTWEPAAEVRLSIEGGSAIYSNAEYVTYYSDPENTRYVVQKTARTGDELRDRLGAHLLVQSQSGPSVSLRAMTERSRNFDFQGFRRTDSAAEINFRVPF